MRLLIIRHGEPDYTHDCLTEAGRKEAAALGEYLASIRLDYLFSSPLGRAQETARIVSEQVKLPVQTLDWTAELPYRPWRTDGGLGYWDIDGQAVRTADRMDGSYGEGVFTGETLEFIDGLYRNLVDHSDQFLAELGYEREGGIYRIRQRNPWQVGVICHGAFGLLWLAHLLAIPVPLMWGGFFLHTTSVSTILFDERQPGIACPRCVGFGAIPHLYHRQLPPSRMGIIANYQ